MKATRILVALATVAFAFALLPFSAQLAFAAEVTNINGTIATPLNDIAKYNEATTKPTITLATDAPGTLQEDVSGWFKKSGENWTAAAGKFDVGTFRYHAVIRLKSADDTFAEGATLTLGSDSWKLVGKERVTDGTEQFWQGTFASPEFNLSAKLATPGPITHVDNALDYNVSWTKVDNAKEYELVIENVTPGFGGLSTTLNPAATTESLYIKDQLEALSSRTGHNYFVIKIRALAKEGYEDSDWASSPTDPGFRWGFEVTKKLANFVIDTNTGVVSWDKYNYADAKLYYYRIEYFGVQFIDGYFNNTTTSLNVDAYIEKYNANKAGNYTISVTAKDAQGAGAHEMTQNNSLHYAYTPKVRTISINGVTPPMEGERATTNLNNYSAEEEHIHTFKLGEGSAYWRQYSGGSWVDMTDTEKFTVTGKYRISIPIKCDAGYKIADNVEVKINGKVVPADITPYESGNARVDCEMQVTAKNDNTYVVTAGALNVRAEPDAGATRLGGLSYGDVVKATGQQGAWTRFEYEGQSAWVNTGYLALTYSEDTVFEDGPTYFTVGVGALNVRADISTTSAIIGGFSLDRKVLATGTREDGEGQTWLSVDYYDDSYPELGHRLGYVLFSKPNSSGGTTYLFTNTTTPPTKAPAEESKPAEELVVSTGSYPKVTFEPYSMPAVALGEASGLTANLADENFVNNDDGYLTTTIYPEDAVDFSALTADKVKLPSVFTEKDMVVLNLAKNDDGSITLTLGPASYADVAYTFSKGADASWTKGSSDDLELKVNRNVDDVNTYKLFTGISVDGVAVDPANYTADSGSLDARIYAAFLETLSAGEHTLAVNFKDGSAETKLTIAAAQDDDDNDSGGAGAGGDNGTSTTKPSKVRPAKSTPATGDCIPADLLFITLLISLAALGVSAMRLKAR